MANIYNGFQAGGYPEEYFPGDYSGNNNNIRVYQATAAGLGFGDPCRWAGSGIEPLNSNFDSIFGFVIRIPNRQISTSNSAIADRFTFAAGDPVSIMYDGIVNLRCHTDIPIATPTLFIIANELASGDGTVGQLTTSNSGDYTDKVIPVRGIVAPLTAGTANGSVPCKVSTNLA